MKNSTMLSVHPKLLIVNAKPVRGDLEAAPVGIYDVIRDDVRELSTVKPIDRVFVERTKLGYRGVLYSHDRPFLFALNGNGFTAKPLDSDDVAILDFCTQLEEAEQRLTSKFDAERADREQEVFNQEIGSRQSPLPQYGDATAELEDAPESTTRVWGPSGDDTVERVPGNYRQLMQGAFVNRVLDKDTTRVCGGGIVMNSDGKVLLIKPTNGFGGYDWTFPKGYPNQYENNVETALREVKEETGLPCEIDRKLGRFTHNDGGTCDYYVMTPRSVVTRVDGEEVEAAKWVTLVEALELLNDDVDVKILAQANQLMPTLIIKGGAHSGTMIALHLPDKIANKIAIRGGESPESMHITLAYLGKGLTEKRKKAAAAVVRKFTSLALGIKASLSGVGRFSASESSEGKDVIYLSVDSPDITRLHSSLMELLRQAGLTSGSVHGFTPHVTLAYIGKKDKTPLERFEPVDINFDSVALSIGGKRMTVPFRKAVLVKALPKMSDDQREASNKKVGSKVIGASSKKLGSGGQVRYNYPGEQGAKPQSSQQPNGNPAEMQAGKKEETKLPHPDLPSPNADQEPIAADHPEKPDQKDVRAPDPSKPQAPKHTLNVAEFCSALNVQRAVIQKIVMQMQKKYGEDARQKFVSFMSTHLAEFGDAHGLDGDYFGLLFDVITGKVLEGQPSSGTSEVKPVKSSKPGQPVAQ